MILSTVSLHCLGKINRLFFKNTLPFLLALFGIFTQGAAQAQTIFTFNNSGTTNWTTAGWVKTGDASAATFPGGLTGETHHVVITGSGTMNLNASVTNTSVKQVSVTGATLALGANSLTINTGGTGLTGTGTVSVSTGTLNVEGNISVGTVNASGGAGTVQLTGNFTSTTFTSGTTGTLIFAGSGAQTTNGYTMANLQINLGASVSTAGNVTVQGSMTNNGTFTQSANRFTMSSTGAQSISGTGTTTFFNFTISANTRTVSVSKDIIIAGTSNGTNANGTDAAFGLGSGCTFSSTGQVTLTGNPGTPATLAGSGGQSVNGGYIFSGNHIISSGRTFTNLTVSNGFNLTTASDLTITGNATIDGTFSQTNSRFTLNSASAQAIGGTGSFSVFNFTISANARTVTLNMPMTIAGTATGTNANGSDAAFGIGTGATFAAGANNVTLSGFTGTPATMAGNGTLSTTGTFIFNGRSNVANPFVFQDITVNSGRFFNSAVNQTLLGNLTNNNGTFSHTGGTITFNASGAQSILSSGTPSFAFNGFTIASTSTLSNGSNITINGTYTANGTFNCTAGTVTFAGGTYSLTGTGTSSLNNVTVSAGTKTLSTNVTVAGNFTCAGGSTLTFDATGASRNLQIDGDATISGTVNAATPGTATNSSMTIAGTATIGGSLNVLNGTNRVNLTLANASYTGTSAHGCADLSISATVTYASSGNFNVGGDLLNNGTFTASNGRLTMLRGAAQSIGGTGTTSFFNLTISDNSRTVTLNHPISIAGTATGATGNGTDAAFGIGTSATFTIGSHTVTMTGNPGTPATLAGGGTLSSSGLVVFNGNSNIAATKTFNNVTVNANRNLLLTVNITVVGDLDVQGTMNLQGQTANRSAVGGTITVGATGNLILGGTTTFPTNYLAINLPTGSLVTYNGANQTVRALDYSNLRVLGGGTKTLGAGTTSVSGTLTMDGAVIAIGANQLNLTPSATLSITSPSASNHINASGTGEIRRFFDAAGSFTFPMGTGTVYTPATVNLSSATFGGAAGSRFVGVRCLASKPTPQLDNTHSLNKHWALTSTNISNINASLTFTYVPAEANALTESLYRPAYHNGTSWTLGLLSEVASNVISFNATGALTLSGNYTAGPNFSFVPVTFYSLASGNFNVPGTWSLVSHTGAASPVIPTAGSIVEIGNSNTVTLSANLTRTFNTLNIASGAELDLQNFSGFTIGTLSGSGKLRLFANSGTAIIPSVTTNTFATNPNAEVEYYGGSNYNIANPTPAFTYPNLTISGSGIKTLSVTCNVNADFHIVSGAIFYPNTQSITVNGQSLVEGTFSDDNNGGNNTFVGKLTVAAGAIFRNNATGVNSPFLFGGGIENHGFFNKIGSGTVTFNTANQTITGTRRVTFTQGNCVVAAGITLTNDVDSLVVSSMTLSTNARFINDHGLFPSNYTGIANTLLQHAFNTYTSSSDAGNGVVFTNQSTMRLDRAGAGSAYAVRTTNISPSAQVHIARFTLATSNTGAQSAAATLLLGSSFADNSTIHSATARLRVNFNATSGNFSVTHPDGTSTTSANVTGTQTVTWIVNRSASAVTYTFGTTNFTVPAQRVDVFMGTTRFAAGLAMQDLAQDITQMKVVMDQGTGSVSIGSFTLNPLTTITTASFIDPCIRVTPTEPYVVSVNYSTSGTNRNTHFNPGNVFTVQLSNASGSFATPVTIGTLTSTDSSGTILATIPGNTLSGTGYRIRVVSSSPLSGATDNGSNLIIERFNVTPFVPVSIIIGGTGTTLTANGPGITGYQWGYQTSIGGTITDLVGKTASTYMINSADFPGIGTYLVLCKVTTSGSCGNATTNYIPLYINCPVTTNLIVNGDFSAGNTGFTSDYTYVADNIAVNNELVPEGRYGVHNNPRDMHNGFCIMTSDAQRSPVSGGNMLMGNAAGVAADLWRQTVTVTPNKDYVFSFYATSLAGTPNTVYFGVFTSCYQTGANLNFAFETADCQWTRYTYQFNSGTNTSLVLTMRNITTVAFGNDLAIDDIQMYECSADFGFSSAEKPVWRGATNDWTNALNWGVSCATIDCTDDYELGPVPTPNVYPVINKTGAVAGNLTVLPGASLTIRSGFNLDLCGDLINTGTITAESNATITMTGTRNPSLISGLATGASRLGNLVINKTSATDTVRLTTPIETSGNLVITQGRLKTAGFTMQLGGNFENNSHFLAQNGTVTMIGNQNRTISNTGTGNFHNLRIEKELEENTVSVVSGVVNVENQLNLLSGKVVANGSNVLYTTNSATNSIINHSASSYVIGNLRRAVSGTGLYEFPLGDITRYQRINVDITTPLVGTSWINGAFDPNTAPGAAPNVTDLGQTFIYTCDNGYWDLTPSAQPTSGTYNVRIFPVSIPCTGAYKTIAKRDNNTSPWTFGGSTGVSDDQRNGFTSFSEFAQVSSDDMPLPVSLRSFVAWKRNKFVELEWTTMSEVGFDHFVIERSSDEINFVAIGKVKSTGTPHGLANYAYTDQSPLSPVNYYRLRNVDVDGKFEFSRIVKVDMDANILASPNVYPNPLTEGSVPTLFMVSSLRETQMVRIADLQGKQVLTKEIDVVQGNNTIALPEMSKLPQGAYMISIHSPDHGKSKPVKWVVQ